MAPAPGAPGRLRSLCSAVLATAGGVQPSGSRVALLYRLPRGVGSGLQWPRPRHAGTAPGVGGPAMASPALSAPWTAGLGKLWGTWTLSGVGLVTHGSRRDRTSVQSVLLEAVGECLLDEI